MDVAKPRAAQQRDEGPSLATSLDDLRHLVFDVGDDLSETNGERIRTLREDLKVQALRATEPSLREALEEAERTLQAVDLEASVPGELGPRLAEIYERVRKAASDSGNREVRRAAPRRLTEHNPFRSAFHAAGGIAAAFAYGAVVSYDGALVISIGASILGAILELARRYSTAFNREFMTSDFVRRVARPDEHRRIWSSTYFAWGVCVAVLLTPPLAVQVGCIVLAIGDPAASMVGRHAGGPKLLEAKSLGGSLAFVVTGSIAALLYLTLMSDLSLSTRVAVATVAATVGAAAELLSRRVDDNLTIPIAASLAAAVALNITV